jgi:hypothetical protein
MFTWKHYPIAFLSSHNTIKWGQRLSWLCVYIVEENDQVSYDFLTIGSKNVQVLPFTQEHKNPYEIPVFPNLAIP